MKSKSIFLILLLLCFVFGCNMVSGLMKRSGTLLIIEVESNEANLEKTTEQAVKVLQSRLDAFGVSGDVTKTSANRIEVKIYNVTNPERIKNLLISQSRLELSKVVSPPNPAPAQIYPTEEAAIQSLGGKVPSNRKILPYKIRDVDTEKNKQWVIVESPPIVDGRDLRDAAAVSRTKNDSDYQITFSLNPAGAQKFGEWTGQNINNYLAVVLNDEVKSVAFIKSQITESGEISGRFTKQSAEDLALILKSGYLAAKLTFVEEKTFGK